MQYNNDSGLRSWRIGVSVGGIMKRLVFVALFFLLLDVAATLFTHVTGHDHVFGLLALLDLDQERGFGMLYQVFLMFLGSSFFFALSVAARRGLAPVAAWKFLGFVFFYLMLDEYAALHERLMPISRELFGQEGILYFAWILPYGLAAAALAVWALPAILRLPRAPRFYLILAGIVYVSGAVGMEGVSGWYMYSLGGESASPDVVYYLLTAVEEGLEMAGVLLLLRGQLGLLRNAWESVELHIAA